MVKGNLLSGFERHSKCQTQGAGYEVYMCVCVHAHVCECVHTCVTTYEYCQVLPVHKNWFLC